MNQPQTAPLDVLTMQQIIRNYQNNPKWENSYLGDVKILSNTHVGDIGQDFIFEWCGILSMECQKSDSKQSAWDVKIKGAKFEVKTATEDLNGNFQFNHIRYHRAYDGVICLGISPNEILFDSWSKGDVSQGKAGNLVTMDKGSSATWKLTKKKADLRSISKFEDQINSVIESILT